MKNVWGRGVRNLLLSAWLKDTAAGVLRARKAFAFITVLAFSLGPMTFAGRAQTNFSAAEVISGVWGSVTNDNSSAIADVGAPSIAGFTPNAPLWYVWTAPQSGEVEFDTIGSSDDLLNDPLDTVLGVYTGSSLSLLSQVAANDDIYPFPQENDALPENIFDLNPTNDAPVLVGAIDPDYPQYYSGPSGLRFNAVGGTTYYIAVDSKANPYTSPYYDLDLYPLADTTGPIVLNWAYKSSGVFRFATEAYDFTGNETANSNSVPPALIQTSQTESDDTSLSDHGYVYNIDDLNSTHATYYSYDVAGVPVTITREAGTSGRVWVYYTTEDGNTNLILNGDQPALQNRDYTPSSGVLIFDDFEMSKTIYVRITDTGSIPHPNRDFTIAITNVVLDPYEDSSMDASSVSPPRVDPNFGQVEVRILNDEIDPKGPQQFTLVTTNGGGMVVTNLAYNIEPTNAIINFAKANFRVPHDATNFWKGTPITLYVTRRGTNAAGATVNWIVDDGFLTDVDPLHDETFPLEPGSDYAVPVPTNTAGVAGGPNPDFYFSATSGTLTWAANNWNPQPIQFTVYENGQVTLDKDFIVDLYQLDSHGDPTIQPGMIAQAKVTILADRAPVTSETPADPRIPAGSVDENYNIDWGLSMAPSINTQPQQNNPLPGTDGDVNGLVVLTNNETLAVGEFDSYDGINYYGICLIGTNGVPDPNFNPGSAFNVEDGYAALCVAKTPNNQQFVVGGSFTSYNGSSSPAGGVARINLNGMQDTSFAATVQNSGGGSGTVYALAVQPNGQVVIGGDFTRVNGIPCNYVARLNTDGSVDTTFNPGTTLDGPVYALSLPQTGVISTNVVSTTGTPQENDAVININSADAGYVNVNYEFPTTNEMQIYYGGNLIYDTGATSTGNGPGQISVPYGPGSTTVEFIVNPGGALSTGINYSYGAVVTTAPALPEIMVGGDFNVSGQSYTDIALFNTNGTLDTSFNPTTGADQPIYALDWQPDGNVLIGGEFQNFNTTPINRFARLNPDGSLDTTNFYVGMGADDTVFCINYDNAYAFSTSINSSGVTNVSVNVTRAIYIGGQFSSYNGTHRLGFARLNTDGTVDTSFLDTTYNQFAGLPKIYSYDAPGVYANGLQSDGNIMIGGSFNEVGGGEADKNTRNEIDAELGIAESFTNANLWVSEGGQNVEPNARDGVRNRSNIARLIGGATPGPGNLGLVPSTSSGYQANRNQVIELVSLVRTNGILGPESANFSILPGTAQNGSDLTYQASDPLDWLAWEYEGVATREHSDGLAGPSGFLNDNYNHAYSGGIIGLSQVNVTILPDNDVAGNLSATYQLANPANSDELYLGGEDIPVACALGMSSSPVSLIDNSQQAGTFGFASSTFVGTNLSPAITVIRQNGAAGNISINYSTNSTGGTAIPGTDYVPIPITTLGFPQNHLTNTFTVSVLNNGVVNTNFTEKIINLQLTDLRPPGNGAAYGISNTVLRLINPNFAGYLTFSATNYIGLESPPSGEISFTVNRVAGNDGSISVEYSTTNGTAQSGVDYDGATNILQWNNGDVSSRTVTLPLINTGVVGTNKQFGVYLSNPLLNNSSDPALFYAGSPGSILNATLTISNNNSYGSVQFSSTNYLVNENGGYATITVVRTGGVAGPAYVDYATADGTALSNANYTATAGVLLFAPNQISASFNVPVTNNGLPGSPPSAFYFNVNLFNPTNLTLGTVTNAQVDILNDQSYNEPPGSTNTAFSASIDGDVLALAYQTNGQIMAGGSFDEVNGLTQNKIVRLNTDGSVDTTFMQTLGDAGGANGTIQTIASQADDRILIGGSFSTVDGVNLNYIARLMTDGTVDSSFDIGAGANGIIYALSQTFIGGVPKIYAGGAFSTINSVTSQGIVRLNSNGTVDNTFNTGSGVDGTVYAIAVYPTNSVYAGQLLVGGSFVHYNGTVVNGLVRLNVDGSVDVGFNPGAAATNGVVNAITIQPDGEVVVGGSFTNFNGAAADNIVRLNDDGSTDTTFAGNVGSGANNTVDGIVLQPDNRILVIGQFSQFNGMVRNGVTRLLSTGATDPTINFGTGANGAVNAALVQPVNGLITLGGAFTAFDGQPWDHIVQLFGLSTTGSGAFEFSSPSYQVTANGIVAPITIIRLGGTSGTNTDGSGDVFVNFSTTAGTATNGVNYTAVSTNVDFPAGAVSETVYVPILDDFAATTNLNVGLLLSNPTPPAILTSQPTALLTILNVNNAISFASSSTNVFENTPGGVANIDIVRLGSTNGSSSVTFDTTTSGSSGIPGVDYYPTNETITFNPGETEEMAQVLIISNATIEKTVSLVLTNSSGTALDAPTNEILTIINNSGSPGQLCFATTNYTVNESAPNVTVTVIRTNGFSGSVTYGYTTVAGTAQPNINYETTSGTVTFNNASTSEPITVPLLQNNPPEGPVTFSIILTNTTASVASLIAPTNTTVTIDDDINAGVAFLSATNYFEETNGFVSVFVQRLGNVANSFSLQFATTNGTAVAGVNYVTNAGTLNFVPGQTLAGITLALMNNEDVSNLMFGITLYPPASASGVELLSPSNTVVVETPAAAGLTFTAPTNSVYKNGGSITVPVVCLSPSLEPVILNSNTVPLSVNYQTVDGTALAGNDYVFTSGTLIFTNGIVTNTITVPIINNSQITGLRTFSLRLSQPQPVPPAKLVAPTNEVITIIDSNSGLSFSTPNYSIGSGGLAPITVIRSDNTNTTSSVAYATTSGGSAVPGTDYYPTNNTLTFAPGQTSATFNVTVIGSSAVEPNKTILLALSNPTNGILAAPSAATLTIYNQNGSYIVPAGVSLASTVGAPGGILQSNQTAYLYFGFRAAGGINVSNLYATLLSSANVTPVAPTTRNYGSLTVNGPSASQEFTLTPLGTNGQTIQAAFQLEAITVGNTTNWETNAFSLTIGSWSTTFSNTNIIMISPEPPPYTTPQIASPYPSIITVSNVGGVLIGSTVTLTNFSDTSPQAVDVLVVSPAQLDTLLMAGVGSVNVGAENVTLTFSNAAPNYLPSTTTTSSPLTNGVYNPTQYGSYPDFP